MSYPSVDAALKALRDLEAKISAYNHALGVLSLDAATAAPKDTAEGRGRTMGVLSQVVYDLLANSNNAALAEHLEAHKEALDPAARRELQLFRREFQKLSRIPAKEYVDYQILVNDAQAVWEDAKNQNDFQRFLPYLEKIVEANRRFAGYYDPQKAPYDALLNEYEPGLTMQTLDRFFDQLRAAIVPLIAKIKAAPAIDDGFLFRHYPKADQERLSDRLMEILGIDRSHCGIAETEHPFTTEFNTKDVRITTHYYEDNLVSSLYSVIHEGGHALYELGGNPAYDGTFLAGGVSMGIHESQSRFYENLIGRSKPFLTYLFPILREYFPRQLADVTADEFYRAVNKAQPSLIRTEADELTYCMHIMVRYELEKRLISGELAPKEVPQAWNRLYKEYLGLDVPDDRQGCLQDSHWAGGAIGYFPSYALGSAYGAQMLSCIERDVPDLWNRVEQGDLSPVTAWLGSHIHRYGSLYEPKELFERACGPFDPDSYTRYLTEKYTALYQL